MYDFLDSVKKVEIKNSLQSTLEVSLTDKVDFKKDWNVLSRSKLFDGHTIRRYIELFNENT